MEPAINPDLTHNLKAPDDLTLEQMRDVGWFKDANVDGIPDDVQLCIHQGTTVFTLNTATGDYLFFDCSKGISLSGTGVVTQNFCKITLTDKGPDPKRPDRNINITINPCTNSGQGSITIIQSSTRSTSFSITDNNINSFVCGCNN